MIRHGNLLLRLSRQVNSGSLNVIRSVLYFEPRRPFEGQNVGQSLVFFRPTLYALQQGNENFKRDLESKANLGKMIEELKELLPNVLKKSLPKHMVSTQVLLRISPTHFDEFNAYLPKIKGHVSYYTTLKTLQIVLTSIILNPHVKLHIQSIKVMEPEESNIDFLCVYRHTTKIRVRWTTCNEGCPHLLVDPDEDVSGVNYKSTSNASLGSHSWSSVDTLKLTTNVNQDIKAIGRTISHLTTGFVGLVKANNRLERVISGIFIFELNEDNTQIVVHTIENVNIIEKSEPQVQGLEVC